MSQSDYIRIKQNRAILRDQIDSNRVPETRAGTYTELKSHMTAEMASTRALAFYTPAFPLNHKIIWGMQMDTTNCPNSLCPVE